MSSSEARRNRRAGLVDPYGRSIQPITPARAVEAPPDPRATYAARLGVWLTRELQRATPDGWTARVVASSLDGDGCRSCEALVEPLHAVLLTYKDEAERVVLGSVTKVCTECAKDLARMSDLGEQAFAGERSTPTPPIAGVDPATAPVDP